MQTESKSIKIDDKIELNAQIYENGKNSWVILTHGIGEHSGRYKFFFDLFSEHFNICAYDLRGHGLSSGEKTYIDNFTDYCLDLEKVVSYLKNNYKMDKHILFGHSMGALIVSSYMQNTVSKENYPEKVFLSAPAVAGGNLAGNLLSNLPLTATSFLSSFPKSIKLGGVVDISKLSHDPRVYEAYVNDPLCSLKIHSKLLLSVIHEGKRVFSRPLRINCELYCITGTGDVLVSSSATQKYFKTIEKNAKLHIVNDGYHELHNEIEKYRSQYIKFLKNSLIGA